MNVEMELRHLAESDRHIAEAQKRIARLKLWIFDWKGNGRDVASAERTLALFEVTLALMMDHRRLIVRSLNVVDRPVGYVMPGISN